MLDVLSPTRQRQLENICIRILTAVEPQGTGMDRRARALHSGPADPT